jgi:hypothetical protein
MTTERLETEIRKWASDPSKAYLFTSPVDLVESIASTEGSYSINEITKALISITERDYAFGHTYILEPFILNFACFCKEDPNIKRWPLQKELNQAIDVAITPYVCPKFIQKKTKSYAYRKTIAKIPQWAAVAKKKRGSIKEEFKIQSIEYNIEEFRKKSMAGQRHKTISDVNDVLFSFASFIMGQLSEAQVDTDSLTASLLVGKFISENSNA